MENITIADVMIALGQMQKDIDKFKKDGEYWFSQYCKEQKEKSSLQDKINELEAKYKAIVNGVDAIDSAGGTI